MSSPGSLGSNLPTTAPRKREKVALQPGFGLRHWSMQVMRMPSRSQYKSNPIPISEVKKHNTRQDAWTILRGYVYDITSFLDHHPGGVDILEQVFGEDCTDLFDEYHSFVNSDFLLEKCLLGVVKK